jgi:antitoxin component of RelBE/YafQ-DinJ toxin-antitoxin module
MSVLDKYAKDVPSELRTVTAPSRLEKSLFDRFQKYCRSRGLTVSEAIRYLIIEALRTAEAPQEITTVAPTETKPKRKPAQSGTSTRPNTNKWKVGNKLPCPICNGWYSSSNFARDHAKKHGYVDAPQFLTAHDLQATEMVAEYKNALD